MKTSFFQLLKQTSWKGLFMNLVLLFVIVSVLIFLFFYLYLPGVTNHGETITVPNLEGMQLEDMDDFLGKRNFRYEVSDSGYSEQYPPLAILKHYPLPGSRVKENRKIYLTVKAVKPASVKMPNLIDRSLKNAELVLRSYGLKLGSIQYKPDLASNAVLEQLIDDKPVEHGSMVPLGTEIDLIVGDGLGNRVFPVPNFLGLEREEADFAIIGSGLNPGSVMVKVLDTLDIIEILDDVREMDMEIDTTLVIKSGHVYRQHPVVGEKIRLGEQVDLWIVSRSEEDSIEIVEKWQEGEGEKDDLENDNNKM